MALSIIVKWATFFPDTARAPSIITMMVNWGSPSRYPLWFSPEAQAAIEGGILNLAKVLLVVMLLGMPTVHWLKSRRNRKVKRIHRPGEIEMSAVSKKIYNTLNDDSSSEPDALQDEEDDPQLQLKTSKALHPQKGTDLTEKCIYQLIETIEFVIGSISNTASYLRLWALSLAHSELSKVFFQMMVLPHIQGKQAVLKSVVVLTLVFPMFLGVTAGIIMVMDFMECSLHALRLHWVEFQNKFFQGTGRLFQAFDFKTEILKKFERRFE